MSLGHPDGRFSSAAKELGKLFVQVKIKNTGVCGTPLLDMSYLERAGGELNPDGFNILSKLSVNFSLGSAECLVRQSHFGQYFGYSE